MLDVTAATGTPVQRVVAGSRPGEVRRIALYSHDTQGLGHIRRNSLVAASLVAARPDLSVLLLSGASEAVALPLPPRTEVVTVPSLAKDLRGRYRPHHLQCSLEGLLSIRSAILEAALMSYAPDVLVVDKAPRGVLGELDRALRRVREELGTRTVLGLRDVLDDPATTAVEWQAARTTEAIASLYDQVWVYGDPAVFDPAEVYDWPAEVRQKVAYTGYLASGRRALLDTVEEGSTGSAADPGRTPTVLGLVGGGQDGALVARAFARSAFPAGHEGVLITGPYLPDPVLAELRALERVRRDLRVLRFVDNVPELVESSAATVSMGGYNSVCELLAASRPTLLVPRTEPRQEQAMRAERLADRGLVDVCRGDTLTPAFLSSWFARAVPRSGACGSSASDVDLDGLERLSGLLTELVTSPDQEYADVAG
jgi:predicted glycosyltransferase